MSDDLVIEACHDLINRAMRDEAHDHTPGDERAKEAAIRALLADRDALRSQLSTTTRELAEARAVIERIRDELMAANLDVSTDDPADSLPRHVFVLRMALETRGENMDELAKERDRLSADLSAVIAERDAALACTVTSPVTGATETLGRLMQERYGREARQWQANHDQRKAERDEARAERDEARERECRMNAPPDS